MSAFQEVKRQPVGDAAEPCGKRCPTCVVTVDVAESPEEGVLRQLLSIHLISHLSHYHGKYTWRIATDHCRLPLALPFTDGLYYLLFSQLSRCLYHFYLLYDK